MKQNKLWAINCGHSPLGHKVGFTRWNRGLRIYRNISQPSRRRFERHMEAAKKLEIIILPFGLDITSYL